MRIIHALTFSIALLTLSGSIAVRGGTADADADADADAVTPLDLDNETSNGPHDFDHLDAVNAGKSQGKGQGKGAQAQKQGNSASSAPQGGFALRGAGGRLRLCPTGDCKASIIDISMHHLHETLANGTVTANRVKNFMGLTYNWTAPVTTLSAEGVNVTTSRFTASLPIEGVTTPVNYTAEVAFYDGNGTSMNGNQIIDVPADGLKFAAWIDSWPFLQDDNKLHLGLRIVSQNKQGGKKPKGTKHSGQGRDKKIDRVELMDAMFFDSPVLAQVDGAMVTIDSNVSVNNASDFVVIDYAFPRFTTLYYDPVASSGDSRDATLAPTSAPGTTTLRSLAPMQSRASFGAVLAVMALSALAFVTF